jgi:hypothetical protein
MTSLGWRSTFFDRQLWELSMVQVMVTSTDMKAFSAIHIHAATKGLQANIP